MTNKAYIVANEQQEHDVLEKLEREGIVWIDGEKPTEFIPIKQSAYGAAFPYALIDRGHVAWANLFQLKEDINIVFDGRKEEQMVDKYVVSQKFMNALEWWKINYVVNSDFLDVDNIGNLPPDVSRWWIYDDITDKERNNRLIAIIRWVNGEDVFEVEKPEKWVVRSKDTDIDGDYGYVQVRYHNTTIIRFRLDSATRFNTKEEAQEWANSHQEVVEVEE